MKTKIHLAAALAHAFGARTSPPRSRICARLALALALLATLHHPLATYAQGTAFTYQGVLFDSGAPANGSYNLQFSLWTDPSAGAQVGGTFTSPAVTVSNGQFAVVVQFGSGVFTGPRYWLQVAAASNSVPPSPYTPFLPPRQELTPTPYAIFAENSAGVNNASISAQQLNTVGAPANGQVLEFNGSSLVWTNPPSSGWSLTGNNGTDPTVNFVGTKDSAALELHVHGDCGMRLEEVFDNSFYGINVLGGLGGPAGNGVENGATGATIAGGGGLTYIQGRPEPEPNTVTGDFGTVGGGRLNIAGNFATVPGGLGNNASGLGSFAAGQYNNASGDGSFAAGRYASTTYEGSFVWSDGSTYGIQGATGPFQFNVWAGGGVGFQAGSNQFTVSAHGGVKLLAGPSAVYSDSAKGFSLVAADQPLITRGWDPFGAGAGASKSGLGRWGLFMEPLNLVVGIPGDDVPGRSFVVGKYDTNGNYIALTTVSQNGNLACNSLTILGGSDLAEPFQISTTDQEVPQGAVVVIDEENPGHLKLSDQPYDARVAGVVSGANGINPGIQMQQQGLLEGGKNVALTGRVYVQADASNGAIKPGDLLTTSTMPGRAMKVSDHAKAQGAILGKAMTGLSEGKGMVLVLVTLQ